MGSSLSSRRSLSGAIQGRPFLQGDPWCAKKLLQGFQNAQRVDVWGEEERVWHVHRFHSYTARTHPALVRTLLEEFLPRGSSGAVVLDPFVGSGTTLVEVGLRGGLGIGLDVNGFALQLARWKAVPLSSDQRKILLVAVQEVVERSQERVRLRQSPERKWDDPQWYEPHVYLELCGLREEIDVVAGQEQLLQDGLLLAFSSLLVKSSRQQADSRVHKVRKYIAQGNVTRWFANRVQEMVRCQAYYAQQVPTGTPAPLLLQADARSAWGSALQVPVDLVLTSPPYFGVYDYVSHQERHRAWLGTRKHAWNGREMASRRERAKNAPESMWTAHCHDTRQWVKQVTAVLRPGEKMIVLVGDGLGSGGAFQPGDVPIRKAAEEYGLVSMASCTVRRPSRVKNAEAVSEHLLLFRKPASADAENGFLPARMRTR